MAVMIKRASQLRDERKQQLQQQAALDHGLARNGKGGIVKGTAPATTAEEALTELENIRGFTMMGAR